MQCVNVVTVIWMITSVINVSPISVELAHSAELLAAAFERHVVMETVPNQPIWHDNLPRKPYRQSSRVATTTCTTDV
jgi:hypothetical protein